MTDHANELRTIGAEMAVIAARRGLNANFTTFRDNRAIVRFQRELSIISWEFDLRTLGQAYDPSGMVRMMLDRAADQLFSEKTP